MLPEKKTCLGVCVHKNESQALLPTPGIVSLAPDWAAAKPHSSWESGEGKCPCPTLKWVLPGLQSRACSQAGGEQLEPAPQQVSLGPRSRWGYLVGAN